MNGNTETEITKSIRQFCTFRVDESVFGIDIRSIMEINSDIVITPVFHAPETVRGYVNIRGNIFMIMDLGLMLGMQKRELSDKSRMILFDPNIGESFGILVDEVSDVLEVQQENIQQDGVRNHELLEGEEFMDQLCSGICEQENDLIILLDAKQILQTI